MDVIVSSRKFDAAAIMAALEQLCRGLPEGSTTKPFDAHVPGAQIFTGARHIRLVMQYDIQTDTTTAHFDVLVSQPDEAGA